MFVYLLPCCRQLLGEHLALGKQAQAALSPVLRRLDRPPIPQSRALTVTCPDHNQAGTKAINWSDRYAAR